MNRYEVCRHYAVAYEVFPCTRCGDAYRCCPVCPGNRSLCLDCAAAAAGSGADRREGGK
jgi:hypothetical protein